MHLSKIFILTSHHTASTAELLAHNLKLYTQVVMIGEQTFGKDEASFRIEDKRSPRQVDWVLSPIVYKVADAQGRATIAVALLQTTLSMNSVASL